MRIVPGLADAGWHDLQQSGAYEWWYVDAVSPDGSTAFVFIWFAGLPFSPDYLTDHELGRRPRALDHAAMFAAVYRDGRQICYALNRHEGSEFSAARDDIAVRIGPNVMSRDPATGSTLLELDVPLLLGGAHLAASLVVEPAGDPSLAALANANAASDHVWNPIAPACRVAGSLEIVARDLRPTWSVEFRGMGYYDHNYGTRPLTEGIRRWHWGRAHLEGRTIVFYHTEPDSGSASTVLASIDETGAARLAAAPRFEAAAWRRRPLCPRFPSRLTIAGEGLVVRTSVRSVLDWGPFYMRFLADVSAEADGWRDDGAAIVEYLDPRALRSRWLRPLIRTRIRKVKPARAAP